MTTTSTTTTSPPTPAETLAGLGHAVASIYGLTALVLAPDWGDWTLEERGSAMDGPVQHLRTLAPRLQHLHRGAGATALQAALYLARAEVDRENGVIGAALSIARSGAVLNHWLHTLAGLHTQRAERGPLTLGELFQHVQPMSDDPRRRLALEEQTQARALETSAHCLTHAAIQLSDQALGLLWLHGHLHGEGASHLRETAVNLFTQGSGIMLCAVGLMSDEPFGVEEAPETEEEESGENLKRDAA